MPAPSPPLASPLSSLDDRYDVVVVGSGYGASVWAARLARAGQRVCVLERGREHQPGDFPRDAAGFLRQLQIEHPGGHLGETSALFRYVVDEDVSAVMGCGLGGTSLINAGVAIRPEASVFQEPRWPEPLRRDREGLAVAFERAELALRPRKYPKLGPDGDPTPRLPKLDALEAAARAVGRPESFSRVRLTIAFAEGESSAGVTQPACELCGDCITGCNTGAKTTLLTTYLADAVAHGAEVFTAIDVRHIEAREGGGYNVHYRPTALMRERFEAPLLHLQADTVVIGAGAIGSSEILLRSRDRGLTSSPRLGRGFSGNATTLAFGHGLDRDVHAVGGAPGDVVGPAIAGVIMSEDAAGRPLMIQETSVSRPVTWLAASVLRWSRPYPSAARRAAQRSARRGRRRWRSRMASAQCYAVTGHDDAGGRITIEHGRVRLRWPGVGLSDTVAAIHDRLAEATEALGGHLLVNPTWDSSPRHPPTTTHPLGGCAMGEHGGDGVTDHRGRVFASDGVAVHPGLYVSDGSVFPGALGCNPLLTICALAERAAALMIEELPGAVGGARPSTVTRRPSASGAGLRFTERMSGSWDHAADPRFSFVCTLVWPSLEALLADPTTPARSIGTVEAPALSPRPLTVTRGHFQLLVPQPDGSHRMVHQLTVRDPDGRSWFVDGHKTIGRKQGRGLWPDTTTLFFDVYTGTSDEGAHLGRGSVVVRLPDLLRQASTMRADGSDGILGSVRASGRFVRSFVSAMARTYFWPERRR